MRLYLLQSGILCRYRQFVKNRISHIAPLFFLFILLLPFTGIVVLQSTQEYLKSHAVERMENHHLATFSLPASTAVWHEEGKELSINGKMFDVQQYSLTGNLLTVTGFFDEDEMTVARLLFLLVHGEKNPGSLHLFLLLQCFMVPLLFISMLPVYRKGMVLFFFFSAPLAYPHCQTEEQPPRC